MSSEARARIGLTSRIVGTGSAFPEAIVDNESLCARLITEGGDTPEGFGPRWILERTGVERRHYSKPGNENETNLALAARAATQALDMAGIAPNQIDGILYATCTPDFPMPASACFLQNALGTQGFALDLNAACSGFQHALTIGHAMIASGQAKNLLLVGSDVLSPITNFRDRKSCILFGDGAGAAVLSAEPANTDHGVLASVMHSDGRDWNLLHIPVGGSAAPVTHPEQQYESMRMAMKGNELFKVSVRTMVMLAEKAFALAGVTTDAVRWIVPHQANLRILEAVAKRLDVPMERVIVNLPARGNTSAATVPTALDQGVRAGQIRPGDLCLINVFGAGITAGVTLLRW